MTDKTTELIARIRHVQSDGYLGATYLGNEHVGDLLGEVLDALEAEHQQRHEAEDGLFRVVKTLGFDTDSAANAREFFGPQTYCTEEARYTKAADIAVAYAADYRTEMEETEENLEAERDALRAAIQEAMRARRTSGYPAAWRILSRAIDTKEEK